jgi:hypothetical protein
MRYPDLPVEVEAVRPKNATRLKVAPPRVREATIEDYAQIAALESRYGLHPKHYTEWEHLWTHNPVYQGLSRWPIGWVCETVDDEVVGYIGNIPLAYEFDGQPLRAATSRSLVVDARYRPYSFSLLGCFFNQKHVDLFLNTSVNEKVVRLQQLFGAHRVPSGGWDRSAFWITNYRGFTASVLEKSGFLGSQALSYPVSAGLFFRDELTGKGLRCDGGKVEAQFCAQFDERFDSFWQRVRSESSGRLLAVRSRDLLDWHFKYALAKNDAWVFTVSDANGISAYGIFCRQDNPTFRLSRMRLTDFQALPGKEDLLKPILECGLEKCQHEGIHMLEAVGFSSEKQNIIESLVSHRRELSSWRYFYKTDEPYLASSLAHSHAWDPTCYDGDCSL